MAGGGGDGVDGRAGATQLSALNPADLDVREHHFFVSFKTIITSAYKSASKTKNKTISVPVVFTRNATACVLRIFYNFCVRLRLP